MLTGLGHRTIVGRHNKNCTIHLGGTGNHVFNIVSMARAINMRVMTVVGLVFNMGGGDCDTTLSFFRGLINFIKGNIFPIALQAGKLGYRRSQSGFPVIDMPDSADIHVRLVPLKFLLSHLLYSSCGMFTKIFSNSYHLKCANALLASAILCVSSLFLIAPPRSL